MLLLGVVLRAGLLEHVQMNLSSLGTNGSIEKLKGDSAEQTIDNGKEVNTEESRENTGDSEKNEQEQDKDQEEDEEIIYVDVSGAVHNSGVIQLPPGSRVFEALEEAVPTGEANLDIVNQARPLQDGEMLRIPFEGEEEDEVKETGETWSGGETAGSANKVNINQAGRNELMDLRGIGEVRAGDIIEYREEHGRFESKEDLKNVSGIGPSTLEGVREDITIY